MNPVELLLHVDEHLRELLMQFGGWTYGMLFGIVFCETGLVIMPFLPGDSLLFAAGALARKYPQYLSPVLLSLIFVAAAFLGDNVNYQLGRLFGVKLFRREDSKLFKRSHLDKTHAFFERHGPKAVILARFVPIVRTFSPFVAGMGAMSFGKFLGYSVLGSLLWVGVFVWGGYLFGSVFEKHFTLVVLGIILMSVLPMAFEFWRHRRAANRAPASS